MSVGRFWSELKRRRVVGVATAYVVVGLAVAETLDLVMPRLGVPDWVLTVFIVALLAGFPFALVLAWALEVSPEGVRVTTPAQDQRGGNWINRHPWVAYGLVFVLGAAVSFSVWLVPRVGGSGGSHAVRSLAVLPFSALSDDSGDQWLAEGLHDQLITELAGIAGLERVISRTSVLRFSDGETGVPAIAETLGVDAVIEGTIFPSRDRVRINVQLISGSTDDHLWAQDYDRPREEALDLVKSVAQDIAEEIRLQVTASEVVRLERTQHLDPAAQEAYFRGRSYWNERTAEGHRRAREQFQRAIDLEPGYAAPYAGMASSYALSDSDSAQSLAQQYARLALQRDPDLAEAHTALAYSQMVGFLAWDAAERGFNTAIDLQPSYATAHQWGAELRLALGQLDEAVEWIARARELDPFSPIILWNEVRILYAAGRYSECLAASEHLRREFSDFRPGAYRTQCLWGAERYQELLAHLDAPESVREQVIVGNTDELWLWRLNRGLSGRSRLRALAELNRLDEFFALTDSIFDDGGFGINLSLFLADPAYQAARQDSRWTEQVLRRVGLVGSRS